MIRKIGYKIWQFSSALYKFLFCVIVFAGRLARQEGNEEIFFKKHLLSERGSSIINKRQKWGADTIALWKLNGMTSTYIEKNKFETR